MRVETYEQMLEFCDKLTKQGIHYSECCSEKTTYICGSQALDEYHKKCGGKVFFLFSRDRFAKFRCSKNAAHILSIGQSRSHEKARRLAFKLGRPYATCPLPLSNDCFATDRSGGSSSQAAEKLVFPSMIILDWSLCASAGIDPNKFGIGEVMGLVVSIRDFISHSKGHAINRFLQSIDKAVEQLLDCWMDPNESTESKIASLGACLCMKGLLIRLTGVNDVIAGCDHLIGYELKSRGLKWPHGILVTVGTLLTLPLFSDVPEKTVQKIANFSFSTGLLTTDNLRSIENMDITSILRNASHTRPERQTLLQRLTCYDEEKVKVAIRAMISEHERKVKYHG